MKLSKFPNRVPLKRNETRLEHFLRWKPHPTLRQSGHRHRESSTEWAFSTVIFSTFYHSVGDFFSFAFWTKKNEKWQGILQKEKSLSHQNDRSWVSVQVYDRTSFCGVIQYRFQFPLFQTFLTNFRENIRCLGFFYLNFPQKTWLRTLGCSRFSHVRNFQNKPSKDTINWTAINISLALSFWNANSQFIGFLLRDSISRPLYWCQLK